MTEKPLSPTAPEATAETGPTSGTLITGETEAAVFADATAASPAIHKPEILLFRRGFTLLEEGASLTFIVRLNCPQFCDLRGSTVLIQSGIGEEWEQEITAFNGVENETDEFTVITGSAPGSYSWTAVYLDVREGRPAHNAVSSAVTFDYRPHAVSLAAWDVPPSVAPGDAVTLKAGAKCNKACSLAGATLTLGDEKGNVLASAPLGSEPWEGSSALYWTTLGFVAPEQIGAKTYTVSVEASGDHGAANTTFSFYLAPQPSCSLTITVLDAETNAPIPGATLALHPQVLTANDRGIVLVPAQTGQLKLTVKAEDYEYKQLDLLVTGDAPLNVLLTPKPIYEGDF